MTTLHEWRTPAAKPSNAKTSKTSPKSGSERRRFRRHDLEHQSILLHRCDATRGDTTLTFGQIIDLSPGGVRVRTSESAVRADQQIRVSLRLPAYAGICPFVDTTNGQPRPRREWTGWMTVSRVQSLGEQQYEVAGQLVDMEEMDRGMLGLYLSTQPLAA